MLKNGSSINGGSVLSIKPFHLQVPIPARWSVACSLYTLRVTLHHHMSITIQTVLFFWVLSYPNKNGRFLRHLLSCYIIAVKLPLVAIPHHTYHLVWYSPALGISTGHNGWHKHIREKISSPLIFNTISIPFLAFGIGSKLLLGALLKINWGMGRNLLVSILMGWTSIYQLFCGSLGTRVMTHSQL